MSISSTKMRGRLRSARRIWLLVTLTVVLVAGSCRKTPPGKSSASPSPGQCNNSYFPVASDLTSQYRCDFSDGLPSYNITVTIGEIGDSSFVRHEESSSGTTLDSQWSCQSNGLMAADCTDLTSPQPRLKLKASRSSGVTIPPQGKWQKGAKWNASYDVTGEMIFGGAPKPVEVLGVVSVANEIQDQEQVTVPGGTFQAMKVVSRTIEHLSLKGGQPLPGDIVFSTIGWYAKDAGLVKLQSDDLKVTTVLTALTRQQPTQEDENGSSASVIRQLGRRPARG